jgi:hypothetical protein
VHHVASFAWKLTKQFNASIIIAAHPRKRSGDEAFSRGSACAVIRRTFSRRLWAVRISSTHAVRCGESSATSKPIAPTRSRGQFGWWWRRGNSTADQIGQPIHLGMLRVSLSFSSFFGLQLRSWLRCDDSAPVPERAHNGQMRVPDVGVRHSTAQRGLRVTIRTDPRISANNSLPYGAFRREIAKRKRLGLTRPRSARRGR